jgi:hypothetical protein
MSVNEQQVGGTHYQSGAALQHWDIVALYKVGYLEGNATKYVSRWRAKNGVEDLYKALHYVEKMIELVDKTGYRPSGHVPSKIVHQFCDKRGLDFEEIHIMKRILQWGSRIELELARNDIHRLIQKEEQK